MGSINVFNKIFRPIFYLLIIMISVIIRIPQANAQADHGTSVTRGIDGCLIEVIIQVAVDGATQAEFNDVQSALEDCFDIDCEIPCDNPVLGSCAVLVQINVQKLSELPAEHRPKYHKVYMTNNVSTAYIGQPNGEAKSAWFERPGSQGLTGDALHKAWCHETLHLCGLSDSYCGLHRGNYGFTEPTCPNPPGPNPCDCTLPAPPPLKARCTKPCTGSENNLMATLDADVTCDNILAIVALAGLNSCPDDPCCPALPRHPG